MDLRQGHCLELMDDLDDNSVDLLFCDLPYCETACGWDNEINLQIFWELVNKVCKEDAPMIFTCSTKFGNKLINSNPKNFRYDLVWIKSHPVGFLNARKMPMRKHENIYVFYRKRPQQYSVNIARHHNHKFKDSEEKKNMVIKESNDVYGGTGVYGDCDHASSKNYIGYGKDNDFSVYDPPLPNSVLKEEENSNKNSVLYGAIKDNGYYKQRKSGEGTAYEPPLPNSILEFKSERGLHSTQKPVPLMEWILKYYSEEASVVLDPTMGSGSMGVACFNMERLFIGIEKDPEIYETAFNRLINLN